MHRRFVFIDFLPQLLTQSTNLSTKNCWNKNARNNFPTCIPKLMILFMHRLLLFGSFSIFNESIVTYRSTEIIYDYTLFCSNATMLKAMFSVISFRQHTLWKKFFLQFYIQQISLVINLAMFYFFISTFYSNQILKLIRWGWTLNILKTFRISLKR